MRSRLGRGAPAFLLLFTLIFSGCLGGETDVAPCPETGCQPNAAETNPDPSGPAAAPGSGSLVDDPPAPGATSDAPERMVELTDCKEAWADRLIPPTTEVDGIPSGYHVFRAEGGFGVATVHTLRCGGGAIDGTNISDLLWAYSTVIVEDGEGSLDVLVMDHFANQAAFSSWLGLEDVAEARFRWDEQAAGSESAMKAEVSDTQWLDVTIDTRAGPRKTFDGGWWILFVVDGEATPFNLTGPRTHTWASPVEVGDIVATSTYGEVEMAHVASGTGTWLHDTVGDWVEAEGGFSVLEAPRLVLREREA